MTRTPDLTNEDAPIFTSRPRRSTGENWPTHKGRARNRRAHRLRKIRAENAGRKEQ